MRHRVEAEVAVAEEQDPADVVDDEDAHGAAGAVRALGRRDLGGVVVRHGPDATRPPPAFRTHVLPADNAVIAGGGGRT
ncbi:hypothetical protein GCM10009814_21520 [Lapillicoccus jejuensis]